MKIIYKDNLEKCIIEALLNPTVCHKCGCCFQIENKEEITEEKMIDDYIQFVGIIYIDRYFVECPNCGRDIDIGYGEKYTIEKNGEEEKNEKCM